MVHIKVNFLNINEGGPNKVWGLEKNQKLISRGYIYLAPGSTVYF